MDTLRNIKTFKTTRAEYARAENVGLWILQILIALVFLMAGSSKLFGNPMMIEVFDNLGLGQWFRYVTGAIEIFSAVTLLVPRLIPLGLIPLGALLLVGTMSGAIVAHLFVFGDSPLVPVVLLAFNIAVLLGRSERLTALVGARR
jgi:putative oxidoreductase